MMGPVVPRFVVLGTPARIARAWIMDVRNECECEYECERMNVNVNVNVRGMNVNVNVRE